MKTGLEGLKAWTKLKPT